MNTLYGKIGIAVCISLFFMFFTRFIHDWLNPVQLVQDSVREPFRDSVREPFQNSVQLVRDLTLLPAGEESSSSLREDSYSPGGVSYNATADESTKWYEDSILKWARRQNCFKIRKCTACGKKFSDCALEYKKEEAIKSVLVGGPLVDVASGKDEIQFTLSIFCDCGVTEYKISGYRNKVVSEVEAPSSGTRDSLLTKPSSRERHKPTRR